MKKPDFLALAVAIGLACCTRSAVAQSYTTLVEQPWGYYYGTTANAISGNLIIGSYGSGADNSHGFVYNSSTAVWTTYDDPGAVSGGGVFSGTFFNAIDGNTIVGHYGGNSTQGLMYDLSSATWTTLDYPYASGGRGTALNGISGNNVVGVYYDQSEEPTSFLYNTATNTWTTLNDPSAVAVSGYLSYPETWVYAISGNYAVGTYSIAYGHNNYAYAGFIYDIATSAYTTVSDPLAPLGSSEGTILSGISGNDVLGYYLGTTGGYHGFLYNMTTGQFTELANPNGPTPFPADIQGNTIVGHSGSGITSEGFILTLPEPSSLALAALAALLCTAAYFWQRRDPLFPRPSRRPPAA